MAAAAVLNMALLGAEQGSSVDNSASGMIALLQEEDPALQVHALRQLHAVVDQSWPEAAAQIALLEELAEEEGFPDRELAAALASKVFFHLEEYNDALRLALGAGQYFDVDSRSEYVDTLIAKCIDEYTELRRRTDAGEDDVPAMDPRMESIVERMFERCFRDGAFTQ
eukprot:CAMPEP_0113934348 /NCGR_PEP_ID=MMETSP1339-20121228/1685_1 /TAXON_ID=94617 /ORGANISM="Fibrocapsa japonica" /LENGTH=167 /DNA_ID=CAMNT_0000936115 /DNA_START=41 /DNA_END=541 /DNA_ORIENTATION=- /assembly_acc=CAM_ASM_000762